MTDHPTCPDCAQRVTRTDPRIDYFREHSHDRWWCQGCRAFKSSERVYRGAPDGRRPGRRGGGSSFEAPRVRRYFTAMWV